jgi:hypothetical protein
MGLARFSANVRASSPEIATSMGDASYFVRGTPASAGAPAARLSIRWIVTSSRLGEEGGREVVRPVRGVMGKDGREGRLGRTEKAGAIEWSQSLGASGAG